MKKTLFSTCLCLSLFASAQYTPFPTDSAFWVINENHPHDNYGVGQLYFTDGDTLILGKSYTKVKYSYLGYQNGIFKYGKSKTDVESSATYNYCFRNDSLNKKVYRIPSGNSTEQLWYNFDLKVGDTLTTIPTSNALININDQGAPPNIIDSISSTQICGHSHKVYWIKDCTPFSNTLVEGLGYSNNFLQYENECKFFEPAILNTTTLIYDTCAGPVFLQTITSFKELEFADEKIQVFPIPSNGTVNINNLPVNSEISVYSILGKLVLKLNSNNSKETINLTDSGIYLIKVSNTYGSQTQKIIIQ